MRRGQRASSSSESEESPRARWEDSTQQPSEGGRSSCEKDSSSDSDVEVRHGMKRSRRFCSSFSLGEDDQSRNEEGVELSPPGPDAALPLQAMETGEAAESTRQEKQDRLFDTTPPLRLCLFRPQQLWLAATRCLALQWPPCLAVNRSTGGNYRADADQSQDRGPPDSSTNESSSWTSSSDNDEQQVDEEVKSRSLPAGRPGISCTTSRLRRVRLAPDPMLASMILEKETFLRIELLDSGEEREDARYRAEWKLSDRAQELAEGVWLSKSRIATD